MSKTLEESYGDHRKVLLKPYQCFNFSSYKNLPDTHVWDTSEDHHVYPVVNDEPVPVIDLNEPDSVILPQVARACKDWGAFQLKGHGLPIDLLDRVESESRRLFSLSDDRKRQALRPVDGISGYGMQVINKHYSKIFWSECFTMASGSLTDDAMKAWPEEFQQFCNILEEYKEKLKVLSQKLINILLASLGSTLKEEEEWLNLEETPPVLHANWYPPCPDPDNAMGLAAHTDSSLITIMYQSNTSGFQVMVPADQLRPEDRWVTVPAVPELLMVNLGDLFCVLSNGLYRSALHRAVVNKDRDRYTVVAFFGPPANAKVRTLGRLLADGEKPMFQEVRWAELVALKLQNNGKFFTASGKHGSDQ